ncbi:hypothetical protein H9P43_006050 [Blastocladiella emersonii ATCC 22665]|nr:hypothetical protein H9P43_006050 [Blastocladiella emersonii ATCC 22665]
MTLRSVQLQENMELMVASNDRRYYVDAAPFQRCAAASVPSSTSRTCTSDSSLINQLLPELSILPRDCSIPGNCDGVVDRPEIDFTRSVASLPLNSEIDRMLDVASQVIDLMATTSTNTSDLSSQAYKQWSLLMALTDDIVLRLGLIDSSIQAVLNQRVAQSQSFCILTFAAFVIATCSCLAAYIALVIRKLQREARSLTTLLYLIPQPMLKELGELSRFLEPGGLTLQMSSSAIDIS